MTDHAASEPRASSAPRVLASILLFNNFAKCCRTVHDLLAQDYPDFHLQVLDSGSTDGSLERLRAEFPGVDMRSAGGNFGYAGGNNIALRQGLAEGYDHVAILNDDLRVPPDYLRQVVATASRHPTAALVGCLVMHHASGEWQSCGGRFSWLKGMDVHARRRPSSDGDYPVTTVSGAAVLFTRRALEAGLLMNEALFMYVEELDLGLRVRQAGLSAYVNGSVVIRHDNAAARGSGPKPAQTYYITRNRIAVTLDCVRWWQKPLFLGRLALEAAGKNVVYRLRGGDVADAYNSGLADGLRRRLGQRDYVFAR